MLMVGVAIGMTLSNLIAPTSNLATFVGFMALPLVLGGGYQLWQTQTLLITLGSVSRSRWLEIGRALIGRGSVNAKGLLPTQAQAEELLRRIFFKANAFAHAGLIVGAVSAVLLGAVSSVGFPLGFATTFIVSFAYGIVLMRLARAGYIPPPDES